MPNRKDVADTVRAEDHRLADADPEADLERGGNRPQTPPSEKVQHEGDILHEAFDPDEVDPGHPPRSPI